MKVIIFLFVLLFVDNLYSCDTLSLTGVVYKLKNCASLNAEGYFIAVNGVLVTECLTVELELVNVAGAGCYKGNANDVLAVVGSNGEHIALVKTHVVGTVGVEGCCVLAEGSGEVNAIEGSNAVGCVNLIGFLNVAVFGGDSFDIKLKVEFTAIAEIVAILVNVTESYGTVLTTLAVAGEKAGGLTECVRMLGNKGESSALYNRFFSGVQAGGINRLAVNTYNVTYKHLAYPVSVSYAVFING